MKRIIFIILLTIGFIYSDCIDGFEVELWGECYNIEETTIIDLHNSGLTGEIPSQIGNLTNLMYLNLLYNELTGDIPPEIGNLTNLTYLDLQWNQLSGNIPSEINNLTNLIYLHLSRNNLSGEIPSNICSLPIDWNGYWSDYYQIPYFNIEENNLCPPYPECLSVDKIGYQNTLECNIDNGDLNLDNLINIFDIIILVECVVSDNCYSFYDINENGLFNVLDIFILVSMVLE